jgi:hypothetical protein
MSLLKIRQFSIDQSDTFTFANANVTGNLNSGNANLGNLAIANFFSGNANALYNIQGGNVVGTVGNATLATNVTASAQSNITSLGSLTGLTVSNSSGVVDFTTTANVTLGSISNLHIGGGSSGYVLQTDGSGGLSWHSMTAGTGNANVGGSATQIQYNDGTNLAGSANLTFTVSTKTLTVDNIVANGSGLTSITGANVTGQVSYAATANAVAGANVSGAVSYATTANSVAGANVSGQVANALVSGTVYTAAQPNITSVGTLTSLTVSGNISSGNANLGNLATANFFSGNGSGLSSITGANVTGAVAYATTANSVAGANVSGEVSFAATANSVAGANVSGAVAYATTANSVAGANVSGAVNLATYATTANAVAGANVSGAVAYATTANSVAGANVSGQVSNALIAGTVYTAAQPNITSVGTLTSLTVSGDSTITGNLTVSGNFEYANVTTFRVKDPIIEQGGNTAGGALASNDGYDRGQLLHYYSGAAIDAFMGWDNSNAEFGFGSNVSVTSEVVTWNSYGNVRASYFLGNGSQLTGVSASTSYQIANGTSNVNVATADGNITLSVGGTANVVTITTTGVNIAGYANLGSGNLTTTGNVTGGYIIGNGSALTSITGANVTGAVAYATTANSVAGANVSGAVNLATYATTANAVAGANVSGEVSFAATANSVAGANVSGQVANALVSGTVYTAAQPNITSVGTLTGVTSTGTINLTGASNVALGAVANIHITGGSANYFLKTDGSGGLSWSALPSTTLSVDTYTGDGSWTMKTLSSTPVNINYTLVAIGGVFQPRSSYSLTGAVITFSDPPPNGAIVEITIINGGTAGSLGYVYQGINSSSTAIAGVRYLIDSSGGAVTLTLPSTASLGDEVGIIDATGSASTNNITVARNGGKIEGASSDLTVSTNRTAFTLVYYNSTQGWVKTQK